MTVAGMDIRGRANSTRAEPSGSLRPVTECQLSVSDAKPLYVSSSDFILEAVLLMGPDPLGASYVPSVTNKAEDDFVTNR